ncbi:MAG: DUF4364 family protein [Lachnospiraceae bacterium]|nr:DUF4364 family protein [Lachnospiraceae bacterium]
MAEEASLTLYKLMILYMLDNVEFPLTNSQLSEFFITRGYTTYFHLQKAINELIDSGFIYGEQIRNSTQYHNTSSGKEVLDMFLSKISNDIKDEIIEYFVENKYELRKESEITAEYYPTKNGEYMVELKIKERATTLLNLHLNLVTKEQAIQVCDHWKEKSDTVYAKIMDVILE